MASLANQTISSTYDGLIKTSTDQPVGVSGVQLLEDGVGNTLALSVGRANQGVTVTGTLTATAFSGPLTGNVTGNLTGNVTGDVTGNLTGNVTGDVTGDLTGTVLTAAQTNITSVGTLSSLAVSGDLAVDTNTLFVDSSANRVGIGTSSPDAYLTVDGTSGAFANTGIKLKRTGSLTGNASFVLAGTSGSEALTIAINDSEKVRIDASGRVGIGTSSPYTEFEVVGKGSFGVSGASNLGVEVMSVSSVPAAQVKSYVASASSGAGGGNGDLLIASRTNASSNIRFFAGSTSEAMRIDSGGTVKISGTTNEFSLDIQKSSQPKLRLFQIDGSLNPRMTISCDNTGTLFDHTFSSSANAVRFAFSGSEKMRIDASGNVGIGTSSPSANLHISSSSAISSFIENTGNTQAQLQIKSTGGSGQSLFFGIDNSTGTWFNSGTAHAAVLRYGGSYPMVFMTNSTERMRIDSSGRTLLSSSLTYNFIGSNTSDGADNERLFIGGGGDASASRGALFAVYGNEYTSLGGNAEIQAGRTAGASIKFLTGDSTTLERMRIDSSGNVLIGQSVASDTTAGVYLAQDGRSTITRDDSFVLQLNRLTSDGEIIRFRQDSSTVGTITSSGTSIGIGFEGGAAANTLDDYEEGTFTPEVADAASGGNLASGGLEGFYTKIGRQVTIAIQATNLVTTGMTAGNTISIRNLPFSVASLTATPFFCGAVDINDLNIGATFSSVTAIALDNTDRCQIQKQRFDGGNSEGMIVSDIDSGITDIRFSLTYFA